MGSLNCEFARDASENTTVYGGSHWIRLYSGLRLTWRTGLANISVITTSIDAMLDGMARRQLIQVAKISLRSTTMGGRNIVADYFSCQ
jgi:hypothetical protein